jgi:hypothetical protein
MSKRLTAEARLKQLQLAVLRIERGRAQVATGKKLSINAVAEEAGVSTALIHNHYPQLAESIRIKQGRSSREQRDAKHGELLKCRTRNRELVEEVRTLKADLAKIASINATLTASNLRLEAILGSRNVSVLARKWKSGEQLNEEPAD